MPKIVVNLDKELDLEVQIFQISQAKDLGKKPNKEEAIINLLKKALNKVDENDGGEDTTKILGK